MGKNCCQRECRARKSIISVMSQGTTYGREIKGTTTGAFMFQVTT